MEIKEERVEIKQEKEVSPVPVSRHPDEATTSQRTRQSLYPEKERRAAASSEDEASSLEPFCQQQHLPHPSLEELSDKKFIARLQVRLSVRQHYFIFKLSDVSGDSQQDQQSTHRHTHSQRSCGHHNRDRQLLIGAGAISFRYLQFRFRDCQQN